jgi:hypothetical protein
LPRRLSSDPVGDELNAVLVLELAEAEAGESGFAAHALDCLAARRGLYGEDWGRLDLARVISGLSEGAADLGSWGAVSLQTLDHAIDIASPHRELIESALRAAVLLAAISFKALTLARDHVPAEIDR